MIRSLARECGFELAGVAPAEPLRADFEYYRGWVERGFAGRMGYLADRRAGVRADPRNLLPSARSVICVGKLYNGPQPYSTRFSEPERAWISRYAWGGDYHGILRAGLERLASRVRDAAGDFEYRVAVDAAPLLERSYARRAGLGWIGRNTCLINEPLGSWFFLGELLVSLELEPDAPPPDRCGSCTRCVEACPTGALTPQGLDARLCISYLTIELRGPMNVELRPGVGRHVFGCDVCQDVCPWNRRAPVTPEPAFAPREFAPPLEKLAGISHAEFRAMFRHSPVARARYTGFLRNLAVAMGNARLEKYRVPLHWLASSPDRLVAEHARWALAKMESCM
ncbi:MAG: tRNA epoxyqueuosine(34) reductase QueG [Bryobacteraceae bacterium]